MNENEKRFGQIRIERIDKGLEAASPLLFL